MKNITFTILCLFHLSFLQGQNNFLELKEEEKAFIAASVDTLLSEFIEFSTLIANDTVDLELKKKYLWLFEDRATVINDFMEANNKLSIQEYSNVLSMQLADAKSKVSYYPYAPNILYQFVEYDKLDDIYLVPVQIKKVLNYVIDTGKNLIKQPKELNLRLTANIYKNDYVRMIAKITTDTTSNVIWKDGNKVINGKAFVFNECKKGASTTIKYQYGYKITDEYQIISECLRVDCKEEIGGLAIPGAACDDKDKNTEKDVYQEDCTCKGDCTVTGTPCDDNDENTINDLYQEDCSCKGECTIVGSPCDDGNEKTKDDVIQEDCITCLGVCIQPIGTACDDGNPKTRNDVVQEDCNCLGYDCEGVLNGPNVPGASCNDENINTINDVYNGDCKCKGEELPPPTPNKLDCVPGTPCDDEDDMTVNDKYSDDCICEGEIIKGFNFYSGLGAFGMLPIKNLESSYQHQPVFGGGLKFMLSPKRNDKIRLHFGAAYVSFKSKFSESLNIPIEIDENFEYPFGEKPAEINFLANNIRDSLTYAALQIPVGISYKILNLKRTELLIELSAKPHLSLTNEPTYKLNSEPFNYEIEYRGEKFGSTPFILQSENKIFEQHANNSALTESDLGNNTPAINDLPLAIGAGLQILQQLSADNAKRDSYLEFHIHSNFFLQNPGFEKVDGDLSQDLKNRVLNSDEELKNAIGAYFVEDSQSNFIEFGISYIIKL